MRTPALDSPAEETLRLRACLNDLVRITALPVLSTGNEPSRICSALLDLLIGMLPLSFVFVRLNDPEGGPSVEMMRVADPSDDPTCPREIGQVLEASLGDAPQKWPPSARVSIGKVEFCIASTGLGLQCELGVVVTGSRKLAFPEQTEAVFLAVAALMINAIPTCIGVMRADGSPFYGNQAVTDYTGLTLEDMKTVPAKQYRGPCVMETAPRM